MKVNIVCGPTATGKTEFAIDFAKEFNGELINVDSRQIYKYLDIGTNKGEFQQAGEKIQYSNLVELPLHSISDIPIHLFNFLEPDKRFSVYEFQQLAFSAIQKIIQKGKTPILVGGTGLYIDAIVKPYSLSNEEKLELRSALEKMNLQALQNKASQLDAENFAKLNSSDSKNPRRLIRFIERLQTPDTSEIQPLSHPEYTYKMYYPKYSWDDLKSKINQRVDEMFNIGLVEEVQSVLKRGYSQDAFALQGIGYKQVLMLLNNEISKEECIELVKISHRQYARRQRTWFEGDARGYSFSYFETPQLKS